MNMDALISRAEQMFQDEDDTPEPEESAVEKDEPAEASVQVAEAANIESYDDGEEEEIEPGAGDQDPEGFEHESEYEAPEDTVDSLDQDEPTAEAESPSEEPAAVEEPSIESMEESEPPSDPLDSLEDDEPAEQSDEATEDGDLPDEDSTNWQEPGKIGESGAGALGSHGSNERVSMSNMADERQSQIDDFSGQIEDSLSSSFEDLRTSMSSKLQESIERHAIFFDMMALE